MYVKIQEKWAIIMHLVAKGAKTVLFRSQLMSDLSATLSKYMNTLCGSQGSNKGTAYTM